MAEFLSQDEIDALLSVPEETTPSPHTVHIEMGNVPIWLVSSLVELAMEGGASIEIIPDLSRRDRLN